MQLPPYVVTLPVATYDGPLELSRLDWLARMRSDWKQGEHVAIMGQTGRGKTTVSRDLLTCRDWVVALAVKRDDDILESFTKLAGYRRTSWPPAYDVHRALVWARPQSLEWAEVRKQAAAVHKVLNDVFRNGGWAVLLDDVAYICNTLGLKKDVSLLLNQARSSHSSLVSCMTQPSSVTQAIPSEVWRQVRHLVAFRYRNKRDIGIIADITGYDDSEIRKWMIQLREYDFLHFAGDDVTLVRG